jgi:hypothetical protein
VLLLLREARQAEEEGHRLREAFIACGASEDFLERLRETIVLVEQLRRAGVVAREERIRMRSTVQAAFRAGLNAMVCLDVVVGRYCADGGARRSAILQQWRAIVPRVSAPFSRFKISR